MDYFCNRGAKDVIPLWRDKAATQANVAGGLLDALAASYGQPVTAEALFAYAYAVLATPRYVERCWDELTIPGPRLPLTGDAALFRELAALGARLLWLHSYGERFVPPGATPGRLPPGTARIEVGVPQGEADYPETFGYNEATQELRVGKGVFSSVRPALWAFSVSGFQVLGSWLGYRMRKRAGKSSSPLDALRPASWQFDDELLDLLWVLDHSVDLLPEAALLLERVLTGTLIPGSALPQPSEAERQGPKASGAPVNLTLEGFAPQSAAPPADEA